MDLTRRALLIAGAGALAGGCAGARHRTSQPHPPPPGATADAGQPAPPAASATSEPPFPGFVQSGPRQTSAVAFTFHGSGDASLADDLLRVAARLSVPITVFAVGRWLDDQPSMGRRLVDGGHEVANHTYTHPVLPRLDAGAVLDEITKCRDALQRHAGTPGRWFRPSGTPAPNAAIRAAATQAGYATVVGYDVDPLDYRDPGAAVVAQRVRDALHPGSIVSLHTGHAGTVAAFEPMIAAARARGLRPVTVSDLLAGR